VLLHTSSGRHVGVCIVSSLIRFVFVHVFFTASSLRVIFTVRHRCRSSISIRTPYKNSGQSHASTKKQQQIQKKDLILYYAITKDGASQVVQVFRLTKTHNPLILQKRAKPTEEASHYYYHLNKYTKCLKIGN
jgi:hypothetical protein